MDVLVYYPFFKLLDGRYLDDEKKKDGQSDEIDDLSFDDLEFD